jgi:hypothetical protein
MALSSHFKQFHSRWMAKARRHNREGLQHCFDRFFTLYVVFNHLYAEATFQLANRGQVQIQNRNRFPDAEAAQEYVVQFLGADRLLQQLNDPSSQAALLSLQAQVCNGSFNLKLNMTTGEAQPDEDADLCRRLTSTNRNEQAAAILEALYSVRCNLFHGRKGFNPIQRALLDPSNVILERVIEILYRALDGDQQIVGRERRTKVS